MKRISESFRIDPVLTHYTSAAATSLTKVNIGGNVDFGVLCRLMPGTVSTGFTATEANYALYSVLEATAATANGSVISGATLVLGCATAGQIRGGAAVLLRVTSDLTTATKISINGIDYQTTQTGVGTSGEGVAGKLASAINGNATSRKLDHYKAVANFSDTGLILVEPDDDMGTGLTIETTGAGSTIVPYCYSLQGVIEVAAHTLSTNAPKYIGVSISTFAGSSAIVKTADVVRRPSRGPAFPGRVTIAT